MLPTASVPCSRAGTRAPFPILSWPGQPLGSDPGCSGCILSTLQLVPVHSSMEEAVCLQGFEGSSSFGCREVRLHLSMVSPLPGVGNNTIIAKQSLLQTSSPGASSLRLSPHCPWVLHVLALPASASPRCTHWARPVVSSCLRGSTGHPPTPPCCWHLYCCVGGKEASCCQQSPSPAHGDFVGTCTPSALCGDRACHPAHP